MRFNFRGEKNKFFVERFSGGFIHGYRLLLR